MDEVHGPNVVAINGTWKLLRELKLSDSRSISNFGMACHFFCPDLHCPFFHKPLFLSMGKGKIHNLGADLVMFNATSLGFASRPLQWEELGNIHLFKTIISWNHADICNSNSGLQSFYLFSSLLCLYLLSSKSRFLVLNDIGIYRNSTYFNYSSPFPLYT